MKVELTKEMFCKLIDAIKAHYEFSEELEKVGVQLDYDKEFLVDSVVEEVLEEMLFNNPEDFNDISYFMWELDFGKRWRAGYVVEDGEDIPLRDAEDLWELITNV